MMYPIGYTGDYGDALQAGYLSYRKGAPAQRAGHPPNRHTIRGQARESYKRHNRDSVRPEDHLGPRRALLSSQPSSSQQQK